MNPQLCVRTTLFVFLVTISLTLGGQTIQPSKDLWTTSVYSYATCSTPGPGGGKDDEELIVGGWADEYHSLLEFDVSGLPLNVSSVYLELYCHRAAGSGTTPLLVHRIMERWDWKSEGTGCDHERLWWADRPASVRLNTVPLAPPTPGEWYRIDITDLYKGWKSGTFPNFGLELRPNSVKNQWSIFRSGDYRGNVTLRPRLVVKSGDQPESECPVRSISCGSTIHGTMRFPDCIDTSNDPSAGSYMQKYSFDAVAGQRVSIDMIDDLNYHLDTYLKLMAPDGRILAQNDDASSNTTNSRIEFDIKQTGRYTIVATAVKEPFWLGQPSSGYFLLTLTCKATAPTPSASFAWTPAKAIVAEPVKFTDTSAGEPTAWFWDFGDGSVSTTRHPEHTFSSSGTYTVRLTVKNERGSDSATHPVEVSTPAAVDPVREEPISVPGPQPAGSRAIVITHGWGSSVEKTWEKSSWANELADAVCFRLGAIPEVNFVDANTTTRICHASDTDVWVFDWSGAAAESLPSSAFNRAGAAGERLAQSLRQFDYSEVHLIAHSAGSKVIHAASTMLKAYARLEKRRVPAILNTYLDAYHPLGDASAYGGSADWADNYVDTRELAWGVGNDTTQMFLEHAYSIDVTGGFVAACLWTCKHSRPYRFYGISVQKSFVGYQFGKEHDPIGGTGIMGFPLAEQYAVDTLRRVFPKGARCVMDDDGNCSPDAAPGSLWSFLPRAAKDATAEVIKGVADYTLGTNTTILNSARLGIANASSIGSASDSYATSTPIATSWLTVNATTDQPANMMRFQWRFVSGNEGFLRVYVDGKLLRSIDQRHIAAGLTELEELPLDQGARHLAAGAHRIDLRFDSFDNTGAIELFDVQLGLKTLTAGRRRSVRH